MIDRSIIMMCDIPTWMWKVYLYTYITYIWIKYWYPLCWCDVHPCPALWHIHTLHIGGHPSHHVSKNMWMDMYALFLSRSDFCCCWLYFFGSPSISREIYGLLLMVCLCWCQKIMHALRKALKCGAYLALLWSNQFNKSIADTRVH